MDRAGERTASWIRPNWITQSNITWYSQSPPFTGGHSFRAPSPRALLDVIEKPDIIQIEPYYAVVQGGVQCHQRKGMSRN
jgi:hypothetical protein